MYVHLLRDIICRNETWNMNKNSWSSNTYKKVAVAMIISIPFTAIPTDNDGGVQQVVGRFMDRHDQTEMIN